MHPCQPGRATRPDPAVPAPAPDRTTDHLVEIHRRIGPVFARAEPRRRVWAYLEGLRRPPARDAARRHVASYAGEQRADGAQRLLTTARWDAASVRRVVLETVREHAGPGGGLFVTGTAFRKKGEHAVAVDRQFNPDSAGLENCQLAVVLLYATPCGRLLPVDMALYLPPAWAEDPVRRARAGVPGDVRFATPSELAARMVRGALAAGIAPEWAAATRLGPDTTALRNRLRTERIPFLTPLTGAVGQARSGPAGHEVLASGPPGRTPRRLLAAPAGAFRAEAPTELDRLTARWRRCRDDVGFDRYEVRSWDGWHRHMALAMGALAAHELDRDETARPIRPLRPAPGTVRRLHPAADRPATAPLPDREAG